MVARTTFVATDRLWSRDTLDESDETNLYPQNVLQSWCAYAIHHITKKYEIRNKFVRGRTETTDTCCQPQSKRPKTNSREDGPSAAFR
jgi:hypothetical protein